jgi:hypothetical protein
MPRRTFQVLIVTALAAAALAIFRRRPIEPPADSGKWTPA